MVLDANGNQVVEVEPGVTAPRDAVMAAEGPMSAPGCLSLFNSAGVTSKRFVRTSKPLAGASLTVSVCFLKPLCSLPAMTVCDRCWWQINYSNAPSTNVPRIAVCQSGLTTSTAH
jgi:hypothetical protein